MKKNERKREDEREREKEKEEGEKKKRRKERKKESAIYVGEENLKEYFHDTGKKQTYTNVEKIFVTVLVI